MHKGHLDQSRKNQRSTKPTNPTTPVTIPNTPPTNSITSSKPTDTPPFDPSTRSHAIYTDSEQISGLIGSDLTGRFLTPSNSGNNYILVVYDYDSNYIAAEPMKTRSANDHLEAYKRIYTLLSSRGLKPQLQRLDNEASTILKTFLNTNDIQYQLAPPQVHQRNMAERAIRVFKNHLIAGLCSTHPDFPLNLWDKLIPQALITLNLMRTSHINTGLSAQALLHGIYDFDKTPMGPPGTKVLIHEKPTVRGTWAPHAIDGWYLGPALQHYRCYRVWAIETQAERIADTLAWLPTKTPLPDNTPQHAALAAATDLIRAIQQPNTSQYFGSLTDSEHEALSKLADIFLQLANHPSTDEHQPRLNTKLAPTTPTNHNTDHATTPRVTFADPIIDHATEPRVTFANPINNPKTPTIRPSTTTQTRPLPDLPPHQLIITYANSTGNANKRRRILRNQAKSTNQATQLIPRRATTIAPEYAKLLDAARPSTPSTQSTPPTTPTPSTPSTSSPPSTLPPVATPKYPQRPIPLAWNKYKRTNPITTHTHNTRSHQINQLLIHPIDPSNVNAYIYSVTDQTTGNPLEYRDLLRGPDKAKWQKGWSNKFNRLGPQGSKTIKPIHRHQIPTGRSIGNVRIVAALKPLKAEQHRIRFTLAHHHHDYIGDTSTPTVEMPTVKAHFNSVISTPSAKYMTLDVNDFYLNTEMERPEYMRISTKLITPNIAQSYDLQKYDNNKYTYFQVDKGIYGLVQAGILAYNKLTIILRTAGFFPAPHVPGLFTHNTRPISFTLCVDDFGVKFINKLDVDYLIDTLTKVYKISIDWDGNNYLGLTLDWNYTSRTVDISMPGYIDRALHQFQHPAPSRPQHSPHKWIAPIYGASTQLAIESDTSPPISATTRKYLQQVIGTLLYYARAVDNTLLVAISTLSSVQSTGTEATMDAVVQLLNYCATHPDAIIRYQASDMILHIHSDASYLSVHGARSRTGGYFYLSNHPPLEGYTDKTPIPPLNGPIHVNSTIMNNIMSSAAEAELGALFHNAKDGEQLRLTLQAMGHVQPATPIQTDNLCAVGIVNNTVRQRRSRAMDIRFYWVRDRVQQKHFQVYWSPGTNNEANYYTKHFPPSTHRQNRSKYLYEPLII